MSKTPFFLVQHFFQNTPANRFFGMATAVSILGLALGVTTLTVALAILSGFDATYRESLLGLSAHAVVLNGTSMTYNENKLHLLQDQPDVSHVQAFAMGEAVLTYRGKVSGGVIKGLNFNDPKILQNLKPVFKTQNSSENLFSQSGVPVLILGQTLGKRLGVAVGEVLQVIVLRDTGRPEIHPFKVGDFFYSGLHEYDNRFAFMNLSSAQQIFGFDKKISGIEVFLHNAEKVDGLDLTWKDLLTYPEYLLTWKELNANLFAALRLEKIVFFLIILPIVGVGTLAIVAALLMFMREKRKSIAMLRALGLSKRNLMKTFMLQGVWMGGLGISCGFVLGSGINFFLAHVPIVKISPQVYFIDHLPIIFSLKDYFIIGFSSLVICLLATVLPAISVSRLNPVEALRG